MATYIYARSAAGDCAEQIANIQKRLRDPVFDRPPATVFEDRDTSGNTRPIDRPGWSALIKALKDGDEVCVDDILRISRSMPDAIRTVAELKDAGVTVRFPTQREWRMGSDREMITLPPVTSTHSPIPGMVAQIAAALLSKSGCYNLGEPASVGLLVADTERICRSLMKLAEKLSPPLIVEYPPHGITD